MSVVGDKIENKNFRGKQNKTENDLIITLISNSHSKISLSINEKCYQISSWIKRKHYPHSFHPPKCHKNKFCTNFSKLIYHFPDEMESNDYLINFSRDWLVCLLIVTWKKKNCLKYLLWTFSVHNLFI